MNGAKDGLITKEMVETKSFSLHWRWFLIGSTSKLKNSDIFMDLDLEQGNN